MKMHKEFKQQNYKRMHYDMCYFLESSAQTWTQNERNRHFRQLLKEQPETFPFSPLKTKPTTHHLKYQWTMEQITNLELNFKYLVRRKVGLSYRYYGTMVLYRIYIHSCCMSNLDCVKGIIFEIISVWCLVSGAPYACLGEAKYTSWI
jgi:hypothetical protein